MKNMDLRNTWRRLSHTVLTWVPTKNWDHFAVPWIAPFSCVSQYLLLVSSSWKRGRHQSWKHGMNFSLIIVGVRKRTSLVLFQETPLVCPFTVTLSRVRHSFYFEYYFEQIERHSRKDVITSSHFRKFFLLELLIICPNETSSMRKVLDGKGISFAKSTSMTECHLKNMRGKRNFLSWSLFLCVSLLHRQV